MSAGQSDLRDALPVGAVVGEYEVQALLGHGGFSIVYRACHVDVGHVVALKEYFPADLAVRDGGTVFPRSTESTPHYEEGRRRFLEEAKRIVEFKDDPGVVTCLGFFRANGTAYIVLENVDGMSLAELLKEREAAGRPLDEGELRSLVVPLLRTLSRLHKADVLHRDIKPSNILVRWSDGRPVLIDFGAAKQQVALQGKSIAPFTERYAALEQVGEGQLGPWTDVYAIGAVMWRIVAGGNPPWDPPNPEKVELRASAALTGKPDPLPSAAELGKGRFSANLLLAIDACLKIRETERIRNCDELGRCIGSVGQTRFSKRGSVKRIALWCMSVVILAGSVIYLLTDNSDSGDSARFTVTTTPSSASIVFENHAQAYSPGMQLLPGEYHVTISAPGFQRKTVQIDHRASPSTTHITLARTLDQLAQRPTTELPEPVIDQARFIISPEPIHARIVLLDGPISYEKGMDLALGNYTIEVSAKGYATRKVLIEHSGPSPYKIVLDRMMAPFTITTSPSEARIELLGISKAYEPGMLLPFDTYRVRVSAQGYKSKTVEVVHDSSPSRTSVVLALLPTLPETERAKQSATFIVDTNPPDATVILLNDGKQYQRAMDLDLGTYRIEVSATGFITRQIMLHHRSSVPQKVTLNRHATITIHADPPSAQIELRNTHFLYHDEVPLPPGRYMVQVSAPGHESKTVEIHHRRDRSVVKVSLERSIYLEVGSDQEQVTALHGKPSIVTRDGQQGTISWHYGASTVTIDPRSRSVVAWKNAGNLKVRPSPRPKASGPTYIKVGSAADDVRKLHGPPSAVIRSGPRQPETWRYGSSEVIVDPQTRRVIAIRNSGNLIIGP